MFEKLKQALQPRYVRLLEEDVSRLRAENRALMNSLLGTAGFPPWNFQKRRSHSPYPVCASAPGTKFRPGAKPTPDEQPQQVLTVLTTRGPMDLYRTAETWTGAPGTIAPADGNTEGNSSYETRNSPTESGQNFDFRVSDFDRAPQQNSESAAPIDLGPNHERLEDAKPELVHALRELVRQYRQEGVVARRHEIRRIRQARLFWQGLQYAWWNPNDMNWHLPFEQRFSDDRELEEMPRYQFVTNFYQGFGLSFIAVLSQDVPSVRFYPQSAQSLEDIAAARAASDVAELIERNNEV